MGLRRKDNNTIAAQQFILSWRFSNFIHLLFTVFVMK
jgi:hypothetical protein